MLCKEGKWIDFHLIGPSTKGRTNVYEVQRKGGGVLGEIRWFGRWRCYSFFPDAGSLYEKDCLRDIADFCEMQTKAHRTGVA